VIEIAITSALYLASAIYGLRRANAA